MPPPPFDLKQFQYASPKAIDDLTNAKLTKLSDYKNQKPHDVYTKFLKNLGKEPPAEVKQRAMNAIRLIVKLTSYDQNVEDQVEELKLSTIPDEAARAIVALGGKDYFVTRNKGENYEIDEKYFICLREVGNDLYDRAMETMDISPEQAPVIWNGIFAALAIMQAAPGPGPIPIRPP